MIRNLLLYLRYQYGEEVLLYFSKEAKAEAQDNGWDEIQKRVVCVTDTFLEEDL